MNKVQDWDSLKNRALAREPCGELVCDSAVGNLALCSGIITWFRVELCVAKHSQTWLDKHVRES